MRIPFGLTEEFNDLAEAIGRNPNEGPTTTVTGDVTGSGSSGVTTTVVGIRGKSVPAPSVGYFYFNGTAFEFKAGSGGGGVWGAITGTLTDQTDLVSALAGKASTGHTHAGVYEPAIPANTYAAYTHVHAMGDVTGLSAALSAKYDASNPSGFISGITSGMVTGALGFTPYNATNPSSFIALASAITGYAVGTNTALAATDTLLAALGKVQGQLNNKQASGSYLTGNQTITLSGDASGSGATTISVTIATFAGSAKGLVPASAGGTTDFLRADGTWAAPASGGGSDPWTYVRLTSDFTTSSASAVDVTGMAFAPDINSTYEVEAQLMVRTATTTVGPRPGCAWPTSCTDGVVFMQTTSAAGTVVMTNGNITAAALGPVGGLPTTTGSWPASILGMFVTGASTSGTWKLQLASETAGTNVTLKAGSWLKYRKVP